MGGRNRLWGVVVVVLLLELEHITWILDLHLALCEPAHLQEESSVVQEARLVLLRLGPQTGD